MACGPPKIRSGRGHFTRGAVLRLAVEFFDNLGCPTWKYLSETHLSPYLLEDAGAPVPVRLLADFVERTSRAEGIDHPGLRAAESVSLGSLGTFGELLLRSRNVFDYLRTGCGLIRTLTTNERFWLEFDREHVRFCQSEADADYPSQGHLFSLGVTIKTLRSVAGEDWIPAEITLPDEAPRTLADISPAFAHARTNATKHHATFSIPYSLLTLPMDSGGRKEPPARGLDFTTDHPIDFADSVRRLAEALVPDGHADTTTAAEASGMSVRTLQRRLAECGLSFSRLALDARMSLAEQWLRETDRPITDVALSLGYNDTANFTRAFRRANGLSPRAYRTSLHAARPSI